MFLKRIPVILLVFACALPAWAGDESTPVRSRVTGMVDARGLDRSSGLHVIYEGQETATGLLKERLRKLGYRLVDDPTQAVITLKLIALYAGPASDRPKFGNSEKEGGFHWGRALFGMVSDAAILKGGFGFSLNSDAMANAWSRTLIDNGVVGAFKPTRHAQEAIVTRMELTVGGATQGTEILSESYAEDLPRELLMAENMRQAAWFME